MKFLGKFATFLAAAVLAGSPIRTTSRYDVTVDVGICDNANQDGHIIASTQGVHPPYIYIAYRGTDAQPGDVVLTVCYLTKGSEDDIINRVDYIISPTL